MLGFELSAITVMWNALTYFGTEQFKRATSAALRGKKMVTPLQIDILFALFDTDGQLL